MRDCDVRPGLILCTRAKQLFLLLFQALGGRCDHDRIGGFANGIDLDRISFRLEKAMSAWLGCES